MTKKILFVDDESSILDSFSVMLRKRFDVYTALGPEEGLRVLQGPEAFAVVVSDLKMPGMDGITFLSRVREIAPDTVRLMLTGFADVEVAIGAVNQGQVFRFLTKPCPREVLAMALQAALDQHRLVMAERELLRGTLRGSIQVLTEALSLANPEAYGRSQRIKTLTRKLAKAADIPLTWDLELTAMLSHIGCMALPRAVLEKIASGQDLTPEEQKLYDSHPTVGAGLLEHIPRLELVAEMIGRQHERYDSHPSTGKEVGARILKIATDYDMLESRGMVPVDILERLSNCKGCYDPGLLAALELAVGRDTGHVLRRVAIVDLQEYMVLEESIATEQGLLLLAKDAELTAAGLRRIIQARSAFTIIEPVLVRVPRERVTELRATSPSGSRGLISLEETAHDQDKNSCGGR